MRRCCVLATSYQWNLTNGSGQGILPNREGERVRTREWRGWSKDWLKDGWKDW